MPRAPHPIIVELRVNRKEIANAERIAARLRKRRATLWRKGKGKVPQNKMADASGVHETFVTNVLAGRR